MTTTRRSVLQAALAGAMAMPLTALSAGPDARRIEYTGADDPAAFRAFIEEQSQDAVVVRVFHAQWCGPCKKLFQQLDEIQKQPGIKIKLIGVDVGPPQYRNGPYKNLIAAHQVLGVPAIEIFADGRSQYKTHGFFNNVPEMTRYLADLTRAVHGDVAPATPRP